MQTEQQSTKKREPQKAVTRLGNLAEAMLSVLTDANTSERMDIVRIVIKSGDMPVNDFRLMLQAMVTECRK